MTTYDEFTILPISTRLDGEILPLTQAGGRWDRIEIQVLKNAGAKICTGWGVFPVLAGGALGECQLLSADQRVITTTLDALQGE